MDPIMFLESVLKGVGQVMFMGSPVTGALFLLGIAVASRKLATMAFLGSLVGSIVGIALNAGETIITLGLFGFNGVLCAEALCGVFTKGTKGNLVYALTATAFSSIVFLALVNVFTPYKIPALTAPFVFATWFFLFAGKVFRNVSWPEPSALPTGTIDMAEFVRVVLKGVGQVMFIDNWVTGAIFCAGLSLGTFYYAQYPLYLGGIVAFIGSLSGTLTAMALKAPIEDVRFGLFGFNSTLSALAVGGIFIPLGEVSLLWGLVAAAFSSIVMAALMTFMKPYGVPTLTSPFVFTTWLFLLSLKLYAFPS